MKALNNWSKFSKKSAVYFAFAGSFLACTSVDIPAATVWLKTCAASDTFIALKGGRVMCFFFQFWSHSNAVLFVKVIKLGYVLPLDEFLFVNKTMLHQIIANVFNK